MEDFRKLFYDEARDLLAKLEDSLMLLESDLENKELINEVFRVMHSLKGSGAMFGYNNLSDFTHHLETLYDQIRTGTIELSAEIIDFTIGTTDIIGQLLDDDNRADLLNLTTEKKHWIDSLLNHQKDELDNGKSIDETPVADESPIMSRLYYIKFEPDEGIFNDGTNPLYLIDELVELGEALVQMCYHKIPDFKALETEKCYLYWVLILSTEVGISEINDVFIFVEDDCSMVIEQLSEGQLFSQAETRSLLKNQLLHNPNDIDAFKQVCNSLTPTPIIEKKDIATVKLPEKSLKEQSPVDQIVDTNKLSEPIETVKVSSKKLDSLINLVSELVTTQARLVTIANSIQSNELTNLAEDFQHLSRQFRDTAFDMRLIPLSHMLVKYKRLVRDLSLSLNKKVSFTTEGTDTELDKSIIAAISDPIMHILRNAMDHGIESQEMRLKNKKAETGNIHLKAEHSGTSILITITDDGSGIDKKKVVQKALEKKLIVSGDDLSEMEIFQLLLLPGFSTSKVVTDVSGRGVGMDIVRKKIEELRGEVRINSISGKGTSVLIKLPLTLSIIDGLLVKVSSDQLIIPLSSVNRIYQVTKEKIVNARNNVVDLEGKQLPFINLPEKFNGSNANNDPIHVVTVSYGNKLVGLVVNELISEYQAVLKPIDKLIETNELFAGATILGDGKVALVLDTNKLIDYYTIKK